MHHSILHLTAAVVSIRLVKFVNKETHFRVRRVECGLYLHLDAAALTHAFDEVLREVLQLLVHVNISDFDELDPEVLIYTYYIRYHYYYFIV